MIALRWDVWFLESCNSERRAEQEMLSRATVSLGVWWFFVLG